MSKKLRTPLVNDFYGQFLVDRDPAGFASRIQLHYSVATLERLISHPDRMARRAAVLALSFLGDFRSSAALGRALADADRPVRVLADNGIRALWRRDYTHAEQQSLSNIIAHNAAKRYNKAIQEATGLLNRAPKFAEAWNQRAVANFERGAFEKAIHDCRQAIELNPYHFNATACMGHAFLKLGNHVGALECFRWSLRLNPGLEQVRLHADHLGRSLKNLE